MTSKMLPHIRWPTRLLARLGAREGDEQTQIWAPFPQSL